MQGKARKQSFDLNLTLSLERCAICKERNRTITYSVQQSLYHMFFSSEEYTEPDVVIIYDVAYEMSTTEDDQVHSKISYSNMTYSKDAVLILTEVPLSECI